MNCKHCKGEWTPPPNQSLSNCPFCLKPLLEVSDVGDKSKPDRILIEVARRFGVSILGDKRLSSILKDFMPHIDKKYQKIFAQAVADGVGAKLLELKTEDAAIRAIKIHTIKDGFRKNNGFDQTAEYVVDCFLFSLGWIAVVEEKAVSFNESAITVLQTQLNSAMTDGCLSNDEIKMLFLLGHQLNLSDDEVSACINGQLTSNNFNPEKSIDKKLKNQKDILCSCNWYSENKRNKHGLSPEITNLIKEMIESYLINDVSFDEQKKWFQQYCKAESISYQAMESSLDNLFNLLADYKRQKTPVLKQTILKHTKKIFDDTSFLEALFLKHTNLLKKGEQSLEKEYKIRDFDDWSLHFIYPSNWIILYIGIGFIVGVVNAVTHEKGFGAYVGMPLLGMVYGLIANGITIGLSYIIRRVPLLDWPKSVLIIYSLILLTIIGYLVIPV